MSDGLRGWSSAEPVWGEVKKIETHIHNYDHWFGLAAAPVGETHRADCMTVTPFVATAGNNTWGATPLQILGSDDMPHIEGCEFYDLTAVIIEDVTAPASLKLHLIQIGFGESFAVALAAHQVTEFMNIPEKDGHARTINFRTKRQISGTKAWLRYWVSGINAPTMNFFFGLHEI